MKPTTTLSRIAALALVTIGAQGAMSVCRWLDDPDHKDLKPPKKDMMLAAKKEDDEIIKQAIVQYVIFEAQQGARVGSGTVVKVQMMPNNQEAYIWVLTCDHEVKPKGGDIAKVKVSLSKFARAKEPRMLKDPVITRGPEKADLAMLRFHIMNLDNLPTDLKAFPIASWSGDKRSVVAISGYGRPAAEVDVSGDRAEYVVAKTTGVLNTGPNKILQEVEFDGSKQVQQPIPYKFASLESKLEFGLMPIKGKELEGKYYNGSAFFLNGDSGGPTLEKQDGVWKLIGVHSVSDGDGTVAKDGYSQNDVHILAKNGDKYLYKKWLDDAMADVTLGPLFVSQETWNTMLYGPSAR
ncbi:MAG: hypothetical protein JSS66_01720 [Armatimonadetes bacterium]|nr:hypothetical protein [Armatimonadota bacterium]